MHLFRCIDCRSGHTLPKSSRCEEVQAACVWLSGHPRKQLEGQRLPSRERTDSCRYCSILLSSIYVESGEHFFEPHFKFVAIDDVPQWWLCSWRNQVWAYHISFSIPQYPYVHVCMAGWLPTVLLKDSRQHSVASQQPCTVHVDGRNI